MKYPLAILFSLLFAIHGQAQQRPPSSDYTKLKISEHGHKDSIIDNKARLYNASLSEPCLQCVVGVIKRTDRVKPVTLSADSSKIIYEVNWYPATNKGPQSKSGSKGLLINVFKDTPGTRQKIAAYIYDNTSAKLFYINEQRGNQDEEIKLPGPDLIKIRSACFWGVASSK